MAYARRMRRQRSLPEVVFAFALLASATLVGCRPAQPPADPQTSSETAPLEGTAALVEAAPSVSAAQFEEVAPLNGAAAANSTSLAAEPDAAGAILPDAVPMPTAPMPPVANAPEIAAPIASMPAACVQARGVPSATLDAYKRDVACHIHSRNGERLYDGAPPPMLRSIVVLTVRIDAAGRPVNIRVLRSNGIRDLERRAVQSVRDAAPLPLPAKPMLRKGLADITETWLFRDDGRFQVRTLASVQATSGY